MKGLSLTLEIVIIAIVLLVTALVILTVFGSQMANILTVFGGVQTSTVYTSQCQTMCSNWCLVNRGSVANAGLDWSDSTFALPVDSSNPAGTTCSKYIKTGKCTCTLTG